MTIQLRIDGMHCSGCANAVRKALEAIPSVTAASIDIGAGRATVETATEIDTAKLVAAVEDTGYEARLDG